MYVIIKVKTPTKLDKNQKELLKNLSVTDLEDDKFNRYNNYLKKSR